MPRDVEATVQHSSPLPDTNVAFGAFDAVNLYTQMSCRLYCDLRRQDAKLRGQGGAGLASLGIAALPGGRSVLLRAHSHTV